MIADQVTWPLDEEPESPPEEIQTCDRCGKTGLMNPILSLDDNDDLVSLCDECSVGKETAG